MDSIDLDTLLRANRLLLAEMDAKIAGVDDRESRAKAIIDDCAIERRQIDKDREALLITERLYRKRFVPDHSDEIDEMLAEPGYSRPSASKMRARIGPQRYRILTYMRQRNQAVTVDEVAEATGLTPKRIRDQIRSDVPEGVMGERNGVFGLMPLGLELLERFESYKRSRGEPLPSLDDPIGEEDEDETSSMLTNQEEVGA